MSLLEDRSLCEPEVQEDPTAYHHALHTRPVHFDRRLGFFIVGSYDLMRQILRDTETFSSVGSQNLDDLKPPPAEAISIRRQGWPTVDTLVTNDPPAHTRIRKLMDDPFRPRSIDARTAAIRAIINDTIDEFIGAGKCDAVADFAVPIPVRVIADILGVPRTMAPKIKAWSDAAVEPLGMMISDERQIVCAELFVEFQRFFKGELQARAEAPGTDLLSHIECARDDEGAALTLPEKLSLCSQLMVAGNETTTNGLAAGVKLLIENPALLAELVRDDDDDQRRARTFANEVLRLEAPVQGLFRIVRKDVQLAGVALPKGARIMLRFAAANRDTNQYERPDVPDLGRRNAGSHLAFGAGIHHCLGANLAREEMAQAFHILIRRLKNLAFDADPADCHHHPSLLLRGLVDLPIRFEAR
jgi:cytochrome P450